MVSFSKKNMVKLGDAPPQLFDTLQKLNERRIEEAESYEEVEDDDDVNGQEEDFDKLYSRSSSGTEGEEESNLDMKQEKQEEKNINNRFSYILDDSFFEDIPLPEDWKDQAKFKRYQRELDEKYGIFKDILLHPTYIEFMQKFETGKENLSLGMKQMYNSFQIKGPERMSIGNTLILLVILFRNSFSLPVIFVAAAFFINLNPFVVLAIYLLFTTYIKRRKPKGFKYRKIPSNTLASNNNNNNNTTTSNNDNQTLPSEHIEMQSKEQGDKFIEKSHDLPEEEKQNFSKDFSNLEENDYDIFVLGGDVSGLYTGALLSRCGYKVCVLDKAESCGNLVIERDSKKYRLPINTPISLPIHSFMEPVIPKSYNNDEKKEEKDKLRSVPPRWLKLGSSMDGYNYMVTSLVSADSYLQAPPAKNLRGLKREKETNLPSKIVTHGSNKEILVEDILNETSEERSKLINLLKQFQTLIEEEPLYFKGRCFPLNIDQKGQIKPLVWGASYTTYCSKPITTILTKNIKGANQSTKMRSLFARENLPLERVACTSYISELMDAIRGKCIPDVGWEGVSKMMKEIIVGYGGQIYTNVAYEHLIVDEETKHIASITVNKKNTDKQKMKEKNKNVHIKVGKHAKVVGTTSSNGGILPLFMEQLRLKPKSDPSNSSLSGATDSSTSLNSLPYELFPRGFETLEEARPHLYILLTIPGNIEELGLLDVDFYNIIDYGMGENDSDSQSQMHSNYNLAGWGLHSKYSDWFHFTVDSSMGTYKNQMNHENEENITTAVIEIEANNSWCQYKRSDGKLPSYYELLDASKIPRNEKKELVEYYLSKIYGLYPQLKGRINMFSSANTNTEDYVNCIYGPVRQGLSSVPSRFTCPGIRAPTPISNLYISGKDLGQNNTNGEFIGGLICAQAVLDYKPVDAVYFGRDLLGDLVHVEKEV